MLEPEMAVEPDRLGVDGTCYPNQASHSHARTSYKYLHELSTSVDTLCIVSM